MQRRPGLAQGFSPQPSPSRQPPQGQGAQTRPLRCARPGLPAAAAHIFTRSPSFSSAVLSLRGEKWPTQLQQGGRERRQREREAATERSSTVGTSQRMKPAEGMPRNMPQAVVRLLPRRAPTGTPRVAGDPRHDAAAAFSSGSLVDRDAGGHGDALLNLLALELLAHTPAGRGERPHSAPRLSTDIPKHGCPLVAAHAAATGACRRCQGGHPASLLTLMPGLLGRWPCG